MVCKLLQFVALPKKLIGANFGEDSNVVEVYFNNEICTNLEITIPHHQIRCDIAPGTGSATATVYVDGQSISGWDDFIYEGW